MEIQRIGSQPSGKGPAEWFTGAVRIDLRLWLGSSAQLAGAADQLTHIAIAAGNLLQSTRCTYFYDIQALCKQRKSAPRKLSSHEVGFSLSMHVRT